MGNLPACANCIIWSSNCSVNCCLTIFKFVSLCLASGESICLSSACFCASNWLSAWVRFCSSGVRCCMDKSFFLRISSSSLSDISFALIFLELRNRFHQFFLQVLSYFLKKSPSFRSQFSSLKAGFLN